MTTSKLKEIPLSAFNEEGWLKPTIWVYLNLVILAKGLLIFIMSLASRGKGAEILTVFFPSTTMLYIAIALSIVPLVTLISLTIGKVQDYLLVKKTFFIICVMQIAAELSLLSKALLSEPKPFDSPLLQALAFYLLILGFSFTSYKTKAFLNQFIDGKGLLQQDDSQEAPRKSESQ